jgi:hypothetical protein
MKVRKEVRITVERVVERTVPLSETYMRLGT